MSVDTHIHFKDDQYQALKKYSQQTGAPINEIIRRLVQRYVMGQTDIELGGLGHGKKTRGKGDRHTK